MSLRAIAVIVRDEADDNVAGAVVALHVCASPDRWLTGTTDAGGIAPFPEVDGALTASHLRVTADGYLDVDTHIDLTADICQQVWLGGEPDQATAIRLPPLEPVNAPVVTLPALRVVGDVFEQETGERFTVVMCSDFDLMNRWQHGEPGVESVPAQRRDAGFNTIRVFTHYDLAHANIGTFLDIDYSRIPDFINLCARYGLYVNLVAYTSIEKPDHWGRLVAACEQIPRGNVLLSLVNEGDLPVNQIDMSAYLPSPHVLCSHGSAMSETEAPWEAWDWAEWHTNGAGEEQRKVGKQPYDYWRDYVNVPVLCSETSRFPDVGMWAGSDLARCEQLAFDAAAGATLLAAGSCFHSAAGKNSTLWDASAYSVASAWARGARSVPLDCQHGAYVHRVDLESADIIRAYQRGGYVVLIRA